MKGYAPLFAHRIFTRPIATFKLVRSFGGHMKQADIFGLLSLPFRRRQLNIRPTLPARMIDLGLKSPVREPSAPDRTHDRHPPLRSARRCLVAGCSVASGRRLRETGVSNSRMTY